MFLIARRGPGDRLAGMWEFPGGKIEPGESPERCLQRELLEELGIDVRVGRLLAETIHDYPDRTVQLLFYEAVPMRGELRAREHDATAWVSPAEMARYDFAPADRPFVRDLQAGRIALP